MTDFGIENSTQILGDFIGDHDLAAQIISLSDEQLTNILDAISELIEFEFEYRFITTNSGELMMIGGNFLFDLPSIETINSKLDSIIDTVNHELKLTNPSGSSTLSHLPPIEDDGFFPELRLMLRVAVNNIDLSEIPAGHFDFEQPDNAIDYSDMIGPQIPMMRQAIKDANSYIDIQAGDDSEVF